MANNTLDILGRKPQVVTQAYTSDNFQLVVGGRDNAFMLLQNANINYAQTISRIYDLESAEYMAYVASRPEGNLTMQNVVTDLDNLVTFLQKYGDVCNADDSLVMSIKSRKGAQGLCAAMEGSLTFNYPVLTSAVFSVSVNDYLVTNNMAMIFASATPGGGRAGR